MLSKFIIYFHNINYSNRGNNIVAEGAIGLETRLQQLTQL